MASFDTYNKLVSAIGDWINRTDLVDIIPQFISLTESEVTRTLRVPAMERRLLTDVTSGVVLLPFDFLEAKSMFFITDSNRVTIEKTNFSKVSQIISNRGGAVSGYPTHFARTGTQLAIAPAVADCTDCIELEYYTSIPSIVPDARIPTIDPDGSNWLLDMAPEIYLFGALHEASMYIKDLERAEYWRSKFEMSIAKLQKMSDISEYSGSELATYGSTNETGVW